MMNEYLISKNSMIWTLMFCTAFIMNSENLTATPPIGGEGIGKEEWHPGRPTTVATRCLLIRNSGPGENVGIGGASSGVSISASRLQGRIVVPAGKPPRGGSLRTGSIFGASGDTVQPSYLSAVNPDQSHSNAKLGDGFFGSENLLELFPPQGLGTYRPGQAPMPVIYEG